MAITHDLLLKGGEVVDPSQGLHALRDVAFKDGKVAAISENLDAAFAAEVVDVTGKLVTPGLIDLHGHFAHGIVPGNPHPDEVCTANGITTCVDAGTVGWFHFEGFRRYVIEPADARIFAFVHLSFLGQAPVAAMRMPDMEDLRWAREDEAVDCIEANRDVVLGVKVRLSPSGTTEANAVACMEAARRIADRSGTKIMVHVFQTPLPYAQVLHYLTPGDIVTHCFQEDTQSVLDEQGRIRSEVWTAYRDGIIFDTAGAPRTFSLPVCRSAIDQGMPPHTISTDILTSPKARPHNSYTLHQHMSIFLELGMSLDQVVGAVTSNPAAAIGRDGLGSLKVGCTGDAAVLDLQDGDLGYEDGLGHTLRASRSFEPVLTVKDGRHWRARL